MFHTYYGLGPHKAPRTTSLLPSISSSQTVPWGIPVSHRMLIILSWKQVPTTGISLENASFKQSGTGFITVGLFTDLNMLIHLFAAFAKCIYPRPLFFKTYFLRFNWTSMIQGMEFGKNCCRLSVKRWWRPGAIFLFRKWPSGFLSLGVSMSLLIDPYPRVYELLQRCLLVTRLSMLSVSYVASHYIS